jgi:hypothetical protein
MSTGKKLAILGGAAGDPGGARHGAVPVRRAMKNVAIVLGCLAGMAVLGLVGLWLVLRILFAVPADHGITATITSCSGTDGAYQATVVVTSHAGRHRSPGVAVEWFDTTGVHLADVEFIIGDLQPEATATRTVQATGPASANPVRCRSAVH